MHTIPRVADYALSHEFDDLRGEFSDLPMRSDESDDTSVSESSSADDSAVGYGESDSDIRHKRGHIVSSRLLPCPGGRASTISPSQDDCNNLTALSLRRARR